MTADPQERRLWETVGRSCLQMAQAIKAERPIDNSNGPNNWGTVYDGLLRVVRGVEREFGIHLRE